MQEEVKKAPRSYTYIMGEGILRMMGKIASRELKLLAAMNNHQGILVNSGDYLNVPPNIGGNLTKVRSNDRSDTIGL